MTATAELLTRDLAHLIHPLHEEPLHRHARVWVKGDGAMLTDADGREYIDGLAGLWNVTAGHGRTELADAMREQAAELAYVSGYAGSSNPRAIELAERLSALCYPSINRFFFTSGGGEATDSSIKMARACWKLRGRPDKTKVISRVNGYHGVTLAAMSATGLSRYWPLFEPRVPGFSHIPAPDPYRYEAPPGESQGVAAANELERAILREGADTVAMFIAEPVQGAGGVIVPPDDYFPRIREICDRYEVLLVADEVITGFGRTGRLFALDHWGVEPDIVQFAKAITSGYFPLRRHRHQRPGGGDARRGRRAVDARLHLQRAPGRLRGSAPDAADHRGRTIPRAGRGQGRRVAGQARRRARRSPARGRYPRQGPDVRGGAGRGPGDERFLSGQPGDRRRGAARVNRPRPRQPREGRYLRAGDRRS